MRKYIVLGIVFTFMFSISGCLNKKMCYGNFYALNKIKRNIIPFIEEYIDNVGENKENINCKYLEAVISKNKDDNYTINVSFMHNFDLYNNHTYPILFATSIKKRTLMIRNAALDILLEQDEESIEKCIKRNDPRRYEEYKYLKRKGIQIFYPVVGFFDYLEIILDNKGNVIDHAIIFADTKKNLEYILRIDSLKRISDEKILEE